MSTDIVPVNNSLFEPNKIIRVRALYLGQRLDLKTLENVERLGVNPLVVKAGSAGYAVLFRFGVAVIFNITPLEEISFISALSTLISDPFAKPETETADIMVDPEQPDHIGEKYVRFRHCTVENIQIFADIMAKTVTVAYYEHSIAQIVAQIEPMAMRLKNRGWTGSTRGLMRNIGETLLIHSKMSGHVQAGEKPDLLWDRPDLERLYMQLESEYEISERLGILRHKLDLVHQTAETLLGIVQAKRTHHVEWYIVLLILFEITMSMIKGFFGWTF